MKKPEPTEMELLRVEEDALSQRVREAGEALAARKGRDEVVDAEYGVAYAAGDEARSAALAAEAAELPAKLRAAQAAYDGVCKAHAPVAARLGELHREAIVSGLDAERAEIVARGEAGAAALTEGLLAVGRMFAERFRLCDEMEALRRNLSAYGIHAAPLPRPHDVAEAAFAAARSAGQVESVSITVAVPV